MLSLLGVVTPDFDKFDVVQSEVELSWFLNQGLVIVVFGSGVFVFIFGALLVVFNVVGNDEQGKFNEQFVASDVAEGSGVDLVSELKVWAESEYLVVLDDVDAESVLDLKLDSTSNDGSVFLDAAKSVLVKNVYGDYVRVRLFKDSDGWQLLVDGFEKPVSAN